MAYLWQIFNGHGNPRCESREGKGRFGAIPKLQAGLAEQYACLYTVITRRMIACLDVDYRDDAAFAAGIVFGNWPDADPLEEKVVRVTDVEPYQSGQFFRRELPCLLSILKALPSVGAVIIDGYVWLDRKPGLGAYLHQALEERVIVIGVAKSKFGRASAACEVRRGGSTRPLFITAAGISAEQAADCIRSMNGPHRIPALLQRVDRLCRR